MRAIIAAAVLALLAPTAAAAAVPTAPMVLPPAGAHVARAGGEWLVGARPGARADAVARRFGAAPVAGRGSFRVARGQARAFAAALRRAGLLRYAEPNVGFQRASALEAAPGGWARGVVVPPALAWPTTLPAIGIVDDFVDPAHPDVGPATRHLNASGALTLEDWHGTAVASAAAGAADGAGVIGVAPGAPLVSYGIPLEFGCGDVASGVMALSNAGVRFVNLSLGSTEPCHTLWLATQQAYGQGTLMVAAAGNERAAGNPPIYPAVYPHVLTVAATDAHDRPAAFSSAGPAVDLAAPGEDVPVAVPLAFDGDGVTTASGTSVAAPMAAGAAAWVAAARPQLSHGQVADVLRASAVDIGPPGFDERTGFGLLNVARALEQPAPPADLSEPNDDIALVDGTAFTRPDRPVWAGAARAAVSAFADAVEDPADVYRIRLPRRARVRVRLQPTLGAADLAAYPGAAETLADAAIASSRRAGSRADTVTLANRGRRARTAYVVVEPRGRAARYTLSFTRQ